MLFLSIFKAVILKWSNAMTHKNMSEHLVNQETQLFKRRSFILQNKATSNHASNMQPSMIEYTDTECLNE